MTPDEFRAAGHALIDWIADYRATLEQRPVRADVEPGDVLSWFPSVPPEDAGSFDQLLTALEERVVPGLTQIQHPMHYGWFPANAALASVLGDIASSGLGALGISWESAPALTEVEQVVCDWLRELTGLSEAWLGTIHDTASTSCLTALLVARETAARSYDDQGMASLDRQPVVYCTSQAHSSVKKAALLAGFGEANVRLVDHDPSTFAMDPVDLALRIDDDLAAGRHPVAVVATVGTTGTTAIDPVDEIVDVVRCHDDIWIHVDAAMAGSAMILPECRHLWQGVEGADSLTWNAHKWLGTILDTSLFYTRRPDALVQVMSTNPSYLWSKADGQVVQYRDWGIPLGRRFRALKLWFHLHLDGAEALRARLRRDLDNARWLARQVEAASDWEVVAPVPLQTICVVHHRDRGMHDVEATNAHTLRWVERVNASGRAYLTPTMIDGRWIARVSIGVETQERHHVRQLWKLMCDAAQGTAPDSLAVDSPAADSAAVTSTATEGTVLDSHAAAPDRSQR